MTPLERAARALHDATESVRYIPDPSKPNDPPAEIRFRDPPKWEDQPQVVRDAYIMRARAVIEAIREPSSPMTHAAQSESHVAGDCEVDYHGIWASMIDALLEEGA